MNNGHTIINDVREMIREDASPEEYQELLNSVDHMSTYERRSKAIVRKWEREADRRKAAEDKLPKLAAGVAGRLAYENFKKNVDILRTEGII